VAAFVRDVASIYGGRVDQLGDLERAGTSPLTNLWAQWEGHDG